MRRKVLEDRLTRARHQDGVRYKDDADIADYLEVIRTEDEERFFNYLKRLPETLRAETIIELPAPFQHDLIEKMEPAELAGVARSLATDDATDFMQMVFDRAPEKADGAFELLDGKLQQTIRRLMTYPADQAGSMMQTEVFWARSDETIRSSLRRLRELKEAASVEGVQYVLVTDDQRRLQRMIPLAELILMTPRTVYSEIMEAFPAPHSVRSDEPLDEAVRAIERYDVTVLPVVDRFGHLLGQITHDDVVDIIQQRATEQMYRLGRVNPEEELHESAGRTGRSRAIWLGINLVNAVLVSLVIGLFEDTLDAVVALAVLMPIVANMAGTASVQTLTVMVRQIALGELTSANALRIFYKELRISVVNGVLFGAAALGVSWVWFGSGLIAAAMAVSMLLSFVFAGIIGAGAPVVLKRAGIDPAVASSVVVITLIDVIAFFSFLAIASALLL